MFLLNTVILSLFHSSFFLSLFHYFFYLSFHSFFCKNSVAYHIHTSFFYFNAFMNSQSSNMAFSLLLSIFTSILYIMLYIIQFLSTSLPYPFSICHFVSFSSTFSSRSTDSHCFSLLFLISFFLFLLHKLLRYVVWNSCNCKLHELPWIRNVT